MINVKERSKKRQLTNLLLRINAGAGVVRAIKPPMVLDAITTLRPSLINLVQILKIIRTAKKIEQKDFF